ncbi:hypothetical protein RFI_03418 [Reticulomyxa filosa]|uniref:Uncharacterized protein n=1 Tax=Reticulomyxa filosa TaxID=46433 RepID=X6P549_RETFI|nr:hypothetical protein RFI_03418 [Reticulomyxa filosa]|eukprot:ETO33675.1 hypothetical protein RFI_03418 [Reticulomyxa filosa]
MQHNEEKKINEVTFENVWKKNMQIRRQFLCTNTPTIVTTIKFKELKPVTSVIKFIGLKSKNALSKKVLAYIFWKFQNIICSFCTHNFNDAKNGQIEKKEDQDGKQIVRKPKCDIYVRHSLLKQ